VTVTLDLETALPRDLVDRGLRSGRELALLQLDALAAVDRATKEAIAVLGLELFEAKDDGFRTLDYSGYDRDVKFAGDWKIFVASNNSLATQWIESHAPEDSRRYVLTSASRREWDSLQQVNL
jgi:hypothetical protein